MTHDPYVTTCFICSRDQSTLYKITSFCLLFFLCLFILLLSVTIYDLTFILSTYLFLSDRFHKVNPMHYFFRRDSFVSGSIVSTFINSPLVKSVFFQLCSRGSLLVRTTHTPFFYSKFPTSSHPFPFSSYSTHPSPVQNTSIYLVPLTKSRLEFPLTFCNFPGNRILFTSKRTEVKKE